MIIVLCTLAAVGVAIQFNRLVVENKRLKRDNDYFNTTYLRKQGATSMWPASSKGEMFSYDLRSFDAGKTWYAVERHGELGEYVVILGKAEVVYPGLMKHLSAMDALTDYVQRQGQFNLNDKLERSLLENAGFQVQVKTN